MENRKQRNKRRRDCGTIRFGIRDVVGFEWLADQGAITIEQCAQLFSHLDKRIVSADAARKTVARWTDRGWAVSRRLLHDCPNFVWLTASGMRVAGKTFPHGEPALATLQHSRDVVDIRLELTRLDPSHLWRSEREIRALIAPRVKGKASPHIPDAEVRLSDGRLVAIERERTAKTVERVRKIQMGC